MKKPLEQGAGNQESQNVAELWRETRTGWRGAEGERRRGSKRRVGGNYGASRICYGGGGEA